MGETKVERRAGQAAFMAAMAAAAGDEALAQRFADSMVRAWLLSRPLEAQMIYDADDDLHGASGSW